MTKTKVMHIAESYGGGVTTAIHSYVKHSPQCTHYLFATIRAQDATGEEEHCVFEQQLLVERKLSVIKTLQKYLKTIDPDVIHLHSSFAGAIGRLLPFIERRKIVYTPHGFAFYRDDAAWKQALYRLVERALLARTAVVAGCGEHESQSATLLGAKSVCTLTNICDPIDIQAPEQNQHTIPTISMLGRASAQKGYSYFANVAARLRSKAHFEWIGGGDEQASQVLSDAGVYVTGWLNREQALAKLTQVDLYFHSAAWDGFPISVLEAAQLQLPVMLRKIGPFSSEGLQCVDDVEHAVASIEAWIDGKCSARKIAESNTLAIRNRHTQAQLRSDLELLYKGFTHA